MRLQDEDQLLSEDYRKKVLDEIEGPENLKRKESMKKRYEVFKDNTKKYVLEMMENESEDNQVVKEIIHRTSNISFSKKIVEKKAMVYKDGAKREILTVEKVNHSFLKRLLAKKTNKNVELTQEQIDYQTEYVNQNSVMKKVNRYVELFRNTVCQVLPYQCPIEGTYYYRPTVLAPYLYDAIEDDANPEVARAYITSYYASQGQGAYAPEHMSGFREGNGVNGVNNFRHGDGQNQTIADSPNDAGSGNKEYIWWSNKYHFTTDRKGKIIPGKQEKDLLNPIKELPFHNFAQGQDGQFWAVGGEDITDGTILLNMLLSDLFYIAKYQGMGIGYMFGKGVPKNAKVGASSFITMNVEEGDPTPQIGFASSNPPIQAHLDMMQAYVALLLSTNKLEVGSISMELSAATAASGIHEMIKRAENTDDIQDQREMYRDGEPVLYRLMAKWHNLYLGKKKLKAELAEIGAIDETAKVKIKFADPQPYISEMDKLEVIKLRKELGLDSMIDTIIRDNPEMSEKEAEAKLQKILEERLTESNNRLKLYANENVIPTEKEDEKEDDNIEDDEMEEKDETV